MCFLLSSFAKVGVRAQMNNSIHKNPKKFMFRTCISRVFTHTTILILTLPKKSNFRIIWSN